MQNNLNKIKEQRLELEEIYLSEYAAKSSKTRGRKKQETPCSIRTEFQKDRDRILHCKAFRRLKHKTQVFISPQGDHYRTRMTHTLEVSQIARTIAGCLRLNEDLTEAIALGHDLGHTPFGHSGEDILNELLKEEGGFKHNEQSLRIVDILNPLNLTEETRNGILKHKGEMDFFKLTSPKPNPDDHPFTLEGQIVKIADRIAYLNHDIEDAITAKIITENELPKKAIKILGSNKSERITFIVKDIIKNSSDSIKISSECYEALKILREWMFDNVYKISSARAEENKAQKIVKNLFDFYLDNFHLIEQSTVKGTKSSRKRLVADYIAGMTDRFAITDHEKRFA